MWTYLFKLTKSIKFIEAYSTLAIRGLDTCGVEDVIALEKPNLLLVPLCVETYFAKIASI